jgi:hypothetical protein
VEGGAVEGAVVVGELIDGAVVVLDTVVVEIDVVVLDNALPSLPQATTRANAVTTISASRTRRLFRSKAASLPE